MDYKNITEQDIRNWVKKNGSAVCDVPYTLLEQLACGDTTLDEFRMWILEDKDVKE